MFQFTAKNAKTWLKSNNFPYTDYLTPTASPHRFADGSSYGIEIPVINSLEILEKTLHWLKKYKLDCNRFNETKGTFLLPDDEIKNMLALCAENNIGITFSLSPRPEYDVNASFYRSSFGKEQCRRVNNNNAIAFAVEEAMRLTELGCRGLIVYDIGILNILNIMRHQGKLPKDTKFKASSHCMASNPMIAKILHENGADSVTMLHDLQLSVLQETRRVNPQLIQDVPIDVYSDKGGFIRFTEIAEIVQVCAPVILKLGASAQNNPYDSISEHTIKTRVQRAAVAIEHLKRTLPEAKQLSSVEGFSCLPKITDEITV